MTDTEKKSSDTAVIAQYFGEGLKAREKMDLVKELTPQDKKQLADGIRNETYTY